MITRRGLIGAFIAAPAIVRASSLMGMPRAPGDGVALKSMAHPGWPTDEWITYSQRIDGKIFYRGRTADGHLITGHIDPRAVYGAEP